MCCEFGPLGIHNWSYQRSLRKEERFRAETTRLMPEIAAAFESALEDRNPRVRALAISMYFGDTTDFPCSQLQACVSACSDKDHDVRQHARSRVCGIMKYVYSKNDASLTADLPLEKLVPILIEAIDDEDFTTMEGNSRWNAVDALGRMGPVASDALPRLEQLYSDPVISSFNFERYKKFVKQTIDQIKGQ